MRICNDLSDRIITLVGTQQFNLIILVNFKYTLVYAKNMSFMINLIKIMINSFILDYYYFLIAC